MICWEINHAKPQLLEIGPGACKNGNAGLNMANQAPETHVIPLASNPGHGEPSTVPSLSPTLTG